MRLDEARDARPSDARPSDARPSDARPSDARPSLANASAQWERFDPDVYHSTNYAALRDDDREIIEGVRDFFTEAVSRSGEWHGLRGLDVGSGSNLYPALSMLPWCDEITLVEFSANNVAWLKNEIEHYGGAWDEFWSVLCQEPAYAALENPREALAERATVRQGSVFELEPCQWDIGTMFFVACSISELRKEFERASEGFLKALVPGAPFAMAYMEMSRGYCVGDVLFPAVPLVLDEIADSFGGMVSDLRVDRIVAPKLLREGYEAMVLVRGLTKKDRVGPGAVSGFGKSDTRGSGGPSIGNSPAAAPSRDVEGGR